MIARTLSFGNAGRLSSKDEQLVWDGKDGVHKTFPMEDIGFVVLESNQISISSNCLERMSFNNVALVVCASSHMPSAQLVPFSGNALTQKTVSMQLSATDAVNGRLWRQICRRKILNQAEVLDRLGLARSGLLRNMAESVKNHDPANIEGQAARIFFLKKKRRKVFFHQPPRFFHR